MTRISLGRALYRTILLGSTVALAVVPGLNAVNASGQPIAWAAASETAEPVYPSSSQGAGEDDEGTIRIPSVSSQEGNFYLAVSDAALNDVDSQQVMDAVRDAVGAHNAKILLGVDQKPNNLKGAAQLVRGMLMFGDSDALSDDWLENGKELGYVGKGWIAIGVMLPENPGEPVEVAVDPGRDVSETAPGSSQKILEAGRTAFAQNEYTQGISAIALSATENLQAPPDRTLGKILALGVLVLIVVAAVLVGLRSWRRKLEKAASAERQTQAETFDSRITRDTDYLRRRPVPFPAGPAGSRSGHALAAIDRQRARILPYQPPAEATGAQLEQLRQRSAQLGLLRRGVELAQEFSADPRAARKTWNQIFELHRARLEDLALFLDLPGAGNLECATAARTIIITHTDSLQRLRTRANRRATGPVEGLGILDELWRLRDELAEVLALALEQGQAAKLKIPQVVGQGMAATLPGAAVDFDDPLGVLRALAQETGGQR